MPAAIIQRSSAVFSVLGPYAIVIPTSMLCSLKSQLIDGSQPSHQQSISFVRVPTRRPLLSHPDLEHLPTKSSADLQTG